MTSTTSRLIENSPVNDDFFVLQFEWKLSEPDLTAPAAFDAASPAAQVTPPAAAAPQAGQFFMMKPKRSSVFLLRPISIFEYDAHSETLKFLIAKRGKGTLELSELQAGDKVILTGPFGNAWADFLPKKGNIALIGGSAGVAPLCALVAENTQNSELTFHFYAGFREGFRDKEQEKAMLGKGMNAGKVVITAEDGKNSLIGRVVDFFPEPQNYDAVLGCGPTAMLKALKKKCEDYKVPCFISIESRYACGVGACLGCTIQTASGNQCACKHGPIFPAQEVMLDD